MNPERIEFEFLGQKYVIRSEAAPDYVRQLVDYIEQKLAAVGGEGVQEPTKRLTLATLYITDELFRSRDVQSRSADAVARVGTLLEMLNRVVPPVADSA